MKKFLLMVILVAIAAWLVHATWLKDQPKEKIPPIIDTQLDELVDDLPSTPGIELYQKGEYKDAVRKLEREIEARPKAEAHKLLYYLALSYEKLEETKTALETWRQLAKEYPLSIYCGEAYYKIAYAQSDYGKKIHYLEKAVEMHPQSPGGQMAAVDLGKHYLEYNLPNMSIVDKQYKARTFFSVALRGNLQDKLKQELKQELNDINKNLVFSSVPTPDSIIYKVKSGDTLWAISRKYKIPTGSDREGQVYQGHIGRINKLSGTLIQAGAEFKIITGEFHAEVDKSNFTLTLYLDNNFVKEYPVAVGATDTPTHTGTFHIDQRLVNPPWTRTDDKTGLKETIPFDDPRHIIGTRWMGFKEQPTVGIHGTKHPKSIGKTITNGCVRMHNKDVEELFDLLPGGAKLIIKE